jgi:hypothetical protein
MFSVVDPIPARSALPSLPSLPSTACSAACSSSALFARRLALAKEMIRVSRGIRIPCAYDTLPPFPYDAGTVAKAVHAMMESLPHRPRSYSLLPTVAAVQQCTTASVRVLLICEQKGLLWSQEFSGDEGMKAATNWALLLYYQAVEYMKQHPEAACEPRVVLRHQPPPMAFDWEYGFWKLALLSTAEYDDVLAFIRASKKQARDRAAVAKITMKS